MPEGASTEDTLKVMEHITTLAHRLRKQKKEKAQERFGLVPNFKGLRALIRPTLAWA